MSPSPRKLPDLVSVDLFVRTVEFGSVGLAAAACGMSQPSASARLQALERMLGIPLLIRSSAGSKPTPQGLLAVEWGRSLLEAADGFIAGASGLRVHRTEVLKIASSLTIAEYLVPLWIGRFQAAFPGVKAAMTAANSVQVADRVRSGEFEIGFVEGPRPDIGLKSVRVGRDRLVVVVSPDHPWARRRTMLRPFELAKTPLIVRESGSGTRSTLEDSLSEFHPLADPFLELESATAVKVAVASGVAPAVISELAVQDMLDSGRLVEVAVQAFTLSRDLRAVWLDRAPLSGAPADFLNLIMRGGGRRPAPVST